MVCGVRPDMEQVGVGTQASLRTKKATKLGPRSAVIPVGRTFLDFGLR